MLFISLLDKRKCNSSGLSVLTATIFGGNKSQNEGKNSPN